MLADANSNPATVPGRQRLSSAERRAGIVKVALELFAKRGFRGTTTRELASAVGVSEPVLYQHFATKRDLYTAIVDAMVGEVSGRFESSLQRLGDDVSDEDFFLTLGSEIVRWYTEENHHIRLLLFSALEGHELAELWHERATTQFLRFVEEHIAKRSAEGNFRVADPMIAAKAYIGAVAHFCLGKTVFQTPCSDLTDEQVVQQFVDVFLNGVRNRAPREDS